MSVHRHFLPPNRNVPLIVKSPCIFVYSFMIGAISNSENDNSCRHVATIRFVGVRALVIGRGLHVTSIKVSPRASAVRIAGSTLSNQTSKSRRRVFGSLPRR
jgi:hypothetical protein